MWEWIKSLFIVEDEGTMKNAYKDDTPPDIPGDCQSPFYCDCKDCRDDDLRQG